MKFFNWCCCWFCCCFRGWGDLRNCQTDSYQFENHNSGRLESASALSWIALLYYSLANVISWQTWILWPFQWRKKKKHIDINKKTWFVSWSCGNWLYFAKHFSETFFLHYRKNVSKGFFNVYSAYFSFTPNVHFFLTKFFRLSSKPEWLETKWLSVHSVRMFSVQMSNIAENGF